MKIITLAVIVGMVAVNVSAQVGSPANQRIYGAYLQEQAREQSYIQSINAQSAANAAQYAAMQAKAQHIQAVLQTCPWREMDGVTQHVAVTWCEFSGQVLETDDEGVRIEGQYHTIYPEYQTSFNGIFFVKHFPYEIADNDETPTCLSGLQDGVYSYETVMKSKSTIRCLDFGIPCDAPDWAKPPAPVKVVTDPRAANASKQRILAANEQAAANGDAFGLLRMGERYRDGDGVTQDFAKAQAYLSRAALTGDPTASNELASLPQTTNTLTAASK